MDIKLSITGSSVKQPDKTKRNGRDKIPNRYAKDGYMKMNKSLNYENLHCEARLLNKVVQNDVSLEMQTSRRPQLLLENLEIFSDTHDRADWAWMFSDYEMVTGPEHLFRNAPK